MAWWKKALKALFGPTIPNPPSPPKAGVSFPPQLPIGVLRADLFEETNNFRRNADLFEMVMCEQLNTSAQRQAEWMARNRNMSHTWDDGTTFVDRITDTGYRIKAGGENLTAGQSCVHQVMDDWMGDPDHRHNILGPYSQVGFGVACDGFGHAYWCANYALPLNIRIFLTHITVHVHLPRAVVRG